MSLVQRPAPERRPSPGLTINLSSNNPFRNRAVSPNPPGSASSMPSPPHSGGYANHRVSTNPFLDVFDADESTAAGNPFDPPGRTSPQKASHPQKHLNGSTLALFDKLTLGDGGHNENMPPPYSKVAGPAKHRPSRSQEEQERLRNLRNGGSSRHPRDRNVFADPSESSRSGRRPRRNSESSVIDNRASVLIDTGEDHRKERRHRDRDREGRHRDGKTRDGKPRVKRGRGVDLIDKLDVSGIYGSGLFHHDGPFDACNPHRNRRGNAPMQAFPKDSANNALGGSGPVNPRLDLDRIHGRGAEGFDDYSSSGTAPGVFASFQEGPHQRPSTSRQESFNPKLAEPVHGDESMGLGTSTFLEGAPASRAAIQRRESETDTQQKAGGLQRKKSLAQRIKGISSQRQNTYPNTGRLTSPEPGQPGQEYYGTAVSTSPQELPSSYQSAGGVKKAQEPNPFFADYDKAYERKGQSIKAVTEEKAGRPRAPSSPRGNFLERRSTNEGMVSEADAKPSGFLSRVKSLKGGRRPRPERPERKE